MSNRHPNRQRDSERVSREQEEAARRREEGFRGIDRERAEPDDVTRRLDEDSQDEDARQSRR